MTTTTIEEPDERSAGDLPASLLPIRRVLVTGSDGTVGRILRDSLLEAFDVRFLTRNAARSPEHSGDISDLSSIQHAFTDTDAVVHLAAASSVDAPWGDVLASNVIGAYNVFEAARRAGVRRVVFASSSHVTGMHEADDAPAIYDLADGRTFAAGIPVRPDSLYGVSKVFGEALGRLYADRFGMDVICLRIGTVRENDDPSDAAAGRPFEAFPEFTAQEARHRLRATWLSHRDCARLFRAALEAPVHWAVVYGTSDNPRRLWDLRAARDLLGFVPLDTAPA